MVLHYFILGLNFVRQNELERKRGDYNDNNTASEEPNNADSAEDENDNNDDLSMKNESNA